MIPMAFVFSIHSLALMTNLHPKVVEFDHFTIRVVYHFPSTKELDGITVP